MVCRRRQTTVRKVREERKKSQKRGCGTDGESVADIRETKEAERPGDQLLGDGRTSSTARWACRLDDRVSDEVGVGLVD